MASTETSEAKRKTWRKRIVHWKNGWGVNLAAVLVVTVVVTLVFAFDDGRTEAAREQLRSEVYSEAFHLKDRIEAELLLTLSRLSAVAREVQVNPFVGPDEFEQLAHELMGDDELALSVAWAPQLVVTSIYPRMGNEAVLGLDYRNRPDQLEGIMLSREAGAPGIVGPVDLVQGIPGILVRIPIFSTVSTERDRFWGVLSSAISVNKVLELGSGHRTQDIVFQLVGESAIIQSGVNNEGIRVSTVDQSLVLKVELPLQDFYLTALPRNGWTVADDLSPQRRIAALLVALAILIPIFLFTRAVNQQHQTRRRFDGLSRRLDLALKASNIGVWELDLNTNTLFWDKRMRSLYGVGEYEPVSYDLWVKCLHPDDLEQAVDDFQRAVDTGEEYKSEFRLSMLDGSVRHVRTIGHVHTDAAGRRRIIGVNWDATDDVLRNEALMKANATIKARNRALSKAKAQMERIAMHDVLTGLPNRRQLDHYLRGRVADAPKAHGLLHIDIDRFKQINDTLGHAAGDAVLVSAARILRSCVRDDDVVARIGGDEFVVICTSVKTKRDIEKMASRIVEEMRKPIGVEGREYRVGVSVGVAVTSEESRDLRELLVQADIALYRAKNAGRDTYRVFSQAMHKAVATTKQMTDELLAAIENDEFVPYYQGQVDAKTGKVVGVEALVRWHHPKRGVLLPDTFLNIAEDINLLHRIDELILKRAVADQKRFAKSAVGDVPVSVNVSARRLADPKMLGDVGRMNIEKGKIRFELIESTYFDEFDQDVGRNLAGLQKLGIGLEIDDFGSGFASILSLMNLRPDRLKIARQIISDVETSESRRRLVSAIIDIANSMDIDVLAEGVETEEQAEILTNLGCDYFQGYAFFRPMKADHFVEEVARQLARTEAA